MKKILLLCVTLASFSICLAHVNTSDIIIAKVGNTNDVPRSIPTQIQAQFDQAANAIKLQIFSTRSEFAIITVTNTSGEVCCLSEVAANGSQTIVKLPVSGSQIYTIEIVVASEKWSGILSL